MTETEWEYMIVHAETMIPGQQHQLNAAGEDGWELVAVANHLFYLKRPSRAQRERTEQAVFKALRDATFTIVP